MNFDYDSLITYVLALVILYMLIRVFLVPIRYLLQIAYHLVVGGVVIWAINWGGQFIDYSLALNPVTALAVGYLGIPGLALVMIVKQIVLS